MPLSDAERRQHKLLHALSQAREYVRWLEGVVARNTALLGAGVDFEDQFTRVPPPETDALRAVLAAMGMDVGGEDLSDYLGMDGDDQSRPKLAQDAPESLKPASGRRISRGIGLLAVEPAGSSIPLPGAPAEAPSSEGGASGQAPAPSARKAAGRGSSGGAISGIDPSLLEEDPAERDSILPGPKLAPLERTDLENASPPGGDSHGKSSPGGPTLSKLK
jgi:hypothetical protein